MPSKNRKSIRYGDPRIFYESTTTKPFKSPQGIEYKTGTVVRGSAYTSIDDKVVSISLPSMAELIFYQSSKLLEKASKVKKRALKTNQANGYNFVNDEEAFFTYIQLCSLGILGLYSALEGMVYELYLRKSKERKILVKGKELTYKEFTNYGFEMKLTSFASQLSGKKNIADTELIEKAKEIKRLRSILQHWNLNRIDDYFTNLPEDHPLKEFVKIESKLLSDDVRAILDHYSLKS